MNRTFTVHNSSIDIEGGRYKSSTPISAAKKTAIKLFEIAKENSKFKSLRKIAFCLRETTTGSKKKMFDYEASCVRVENKYKILVSALKHKHKKQRKVKGGNPKNYVVITDIGRDIDDTLALMVLLHKHVQKEINLCAIVVAGHELEKRENLVYYWLWKYNIMDIPILISPEIKQSTDPFTLKNQLKCIFPDDYDENIINEFKQSYDAKNYKMQHILTTNENINILCIA
jgi:hypothetical protein